MASFDNLPGLDPSFLRPQFPADPCFSADLLPSDYFPYNILLNNTTNPLSDPNTPRLTVSSTASGSDPEMAMKRSGRGSAPAAGRVVKRKSRASKKNPTTFITADPANFRQMVQQVTGVKFPLGQAPSMGTSVLKPEPQRLGGSAAALIGGRLLGCLPTLDTSAFLLDHHQKVAGQGSISESPSGTESAALAVPSVCENGGDGGGFSVGGGGGGMDFGSFSCFPTLDSWKVM